MPPCGSPACGQAAFTKQVTAAGFQLKGAGWDATDFKGSGKPSAQPTDGGAGPAAGNHGRGQSQTQLQTLPPETQRPPAQCRCQRPILAEGRHSHQWLSPEQSGHPTDAIADLPDRPDGSAASGDHHLGVAVVGWRARRGVWWIPVGADFACAGGLHRLGRQVARHPWFGVVLVVSVIAVTGPWSPTWQGAGGSASWDRPVQHPNRQVDPNSVKTSDTLSSNGNAFRTAMLVQYPVRVAGRLPFRPACPVAKWKTISGPDFVSVYVPTTPNPTSGFFLMLPRADVIELQMSVDEALTYVISMGSGCAVPAHDAAAEGQTLIFATAAARSP